MRNLKKILAMVLALVMSLSLMATAGAGSFQDVTDDNQYKTAIDVLDELKVFQGFEDGSFKPADTLNRAQAAVLVYRIATGDVEGKYVDNYTYMAQSKFNDLEGYNWAKGYINYCQNAKIVVGTSATTFSPEKEVTGYQLMVMLLRTLGYGAAGEFTDPTKWELETAKIAEREGILKNVTGGDFGAPAPRQMVAEILFRGLLHDTMQYSPLTVGGYTPSGEILGKRVGLEEVTGVVVANEWANLEGSKPLAEGKTILKVDGKNRTIDVSTSGADLGTSVHAYLKGATVLTAVEDAGNDIRTNEGAKTSVKDLRGSMDVDNDTEYFINYAEVTKEYSDWRLEYVVVLKDWTEKEIAQLVYDNGGVAFKDADKDLTVDAAEKASCIYPEDTNNANSAKWLKDNGTGPKDTYTYDKSIKAGTKLSSTDLSYMEMIFRGSDSFNDDAYQGHDIMNGEVYAATKSGKYDADKSYDVSDDLSWNEFCEKYLDMNANDSISGADQGESLRVIDNDGDGVAEYVLRVDFVMTTVTSYDKKTDAYLVEYDEAADRYDGTAISASAIKAMDGQEPDLSTNAVILYSKIDGVYYTKNPEVYTATIDKKGIDTKDQTFDVDGEEHNWSGIDKKAQHYYEELKELAEQVKYDFHLDYFGNARLANESNKGFVLLTDGYYWSNRRDDEKKVELYDDEAGELIEANVTDYNSNQRYNGGYFIDTSANGDRIDDAWKRLNTFGVTHYGDVGNKIFTTAAAPNYNRYTKYSYTNTVQDPFTTNIAAYVEDDGTYALYPVEFERGVNPNLNRGEGYNAYELVGTKSGSAYRDSEITVKAGDVKVKDNALYGITAWNADGNVDSVQRVMTTSNTQYYFVTRSGAKQLASVEAWKGYNNAPDSVKDLTPQRAYVVSYPSDTTGSDEYDVAEIVVFEGAYEKPVYNAWLVFAARTNTNLEYSLGVDPDGEDGYGDYYTSLGVFAGKTDLKSAGDLDGKYSENLLKFWTSVYDSDLKRNVPVEAPVDGKTYADYGIYVGRINTRQDVDYQDYITFGEGKRVDKKIDIANDFVEYRFIFDSTETESDINAVAAGETTRLYDGDRVIYMLNADGDIGMIVNLDDSVDENGKHIDLDKIDQLPDLYDEIKAEQDDNRADPITFENVTVKGRKVDLTTNRITIPAAVGTDASIVDLSFKTDADTVVVKRNGTTDVPMTEGSGATIDVWSSGNNAMVAGADYTYTIMLGRNGEDSMVVKTIEVHVNTKGSVATIESLTIKGVPVTNIPGLTSGAADITEAITVSYDANQDTTIRQIEVVTTDPNASWAVTDGGSFGFDTADETEVKTALTAKDNATGTVITVTAEDGTTAAYTLTDLTVKDKPLTFAGAASYTGSKYWIGEKTGNGTALTASAADVGYTKDITIEVVAPTIATKEVTEVSYTIAGANKVVLGTGAGTYVIQAADLAGKAGAIVVTVTEANNSRVVKKTTGTSTIKCDATNMNQLTLDTTDNVKANKDLELTFTVTPTANYYITSVTYTVAGGQAQTANLDANGKFTVAAGTGAIVVTVNEEPLKVVTNSTGVELQMDKGDGYNGIANGSTIQVKPGTTIKIKTDANKKPTFSDITKAEIVGTWTEAAGNAGWVWNVRITDSVAVSGLVGEY